MKPELSGALTWLTESFSWRVSPGGSPWTGNFMWQRPLWGMSQQDTGTHNECPSKGILLRNEWQVYSELSVPCLLVPNPGTESSVTTWVYHIPSKTSDQVRHETCHHKSKEEWLIHPPSRNSCLQGPSGGIIMKGTGGNSVSCSPGAPPYSCGLPGSPTMLISSTSLQKKVFLQDYPPQVMTSSQTPSPSGLPPPAASWDMVETRFCQGCPGIIYLLMGTHVVYQ